MSKLTGELSVSQTRHIPSHYDFAGLDLLERFRYSQHLARAAESLARTGLGHIAEKYAKPLRGWRTIAQVRRAGSQGIKAFVLAEQQQGIGVAQTRTHERPVLFSSNGATKSQQISYWLGDPEAANRQVHEAVLNFLIQDTDRSTEVWTVTPEMPLSYSIDVRRRGWQLMDAQTSVLEKAGFTDQGSIEKYSELCSVDMPFGTLYVRPAAPTKAA